MKHHIYFCFYYSFVVKSGLRYNKQHENVSVELIVSFLELTAPYSLRTFVLTAEQALPSIKRYFLNQTQFVLYLDLKIII